MMTREEIIIEMKEEIDRLTHLSSCRPKKAYIEPAYEDGEFTGESILPLLDRWGDRKVSA